MKNSCHCQQDWYEPEKCKNGTCEFFHCDNCEKKAVKNGWIPKIARRMEDKKGFHEAFFCGGLAGCVHMHGRLSEERDSIKQRLEKLSKSDKENLKEWMDIIDDLLHAQAEKIKVQTDKIRQEERERAVSIVDKFLFELDDIDVTKIDTLKKILNPKNDETKS